MKILFVEENYQYELGEELTARLNEHFEYIPFCQLTLNDGWEQEEQDKERPKLFKAVHPWEISQSFILNDMVLIQAIKDIIQ